MTGTPDRIRVGVAGLFGTGNFGNEATLTAALDRLASDHEVLVVAQGARRVRRERDVAAVALSAPATVTGTRWTRPFRIGWNRLGVLRRAFTVVCRLDAVVVAGGGAWERLGAGPFGLAYEYWCLALAARAFRRPFILWNVGVEVQDRPLTRWFIRRTARWSSYRSFRDKRSLRAMRRMRCGHEEDPVVADLVFGLRSEQPRPEPAMKPPRVVVGVMNYFGETDDPDANRRDHEAYLTRTVATVRVLRGRGYGVTVIGGDEYDLPAAERIQALVADDEVLVAENGSVPGLLAVMRSVSAVVAVRYHSLVMGALAGAPLVALAYGEKHQSLLRMLGSPDRVRHVDSFDPEDVARLVDQAVVDADGRERAAAAMADAAAQLDEQWDTLRTILRREGLSAGRMRTAGASR